MYLTLQALFFMVNIILLPWDCRPLPCFVQPDLRDDNLPQPNKLSYPRLLKEPVLYSYSYTHPGYH